MQTAPKGTYTGMVQCATGILKNEGPLAFYKVTVLALGNPLREVLIALASTSGYPHSTPGNRRLRIYSIRGPRVNKTLFCRAEPA